MNRAFLGTTILVSAKGQFVPIKGLRRFRVKNGWVIPRPSFFVGVLGIVQTIYAIERNRRFDSQRLSTMTVMTWYLNQLKLLFTSCDFYKRTLCRRPFLVIVSAYLHRTP